MRKIILFTVLLGYCCNGEEKNEAKLERQMMGPGLPMQPAIGRQYGPFNPFTTNPFTNIFGQGNAYEYATCVLEPRGSGYNVNGIVRLRQLITANRGMPSPLEISININGLVPNSQHGFHIHEFGDLTNDCTSAEAHYNPYGTQHGSERDQAYTTFQNPYSAFPFNQFQNFRPKTRHVGDLGNIVADSFGTVNTYKYDNVARITPSAFDNRANVMGRALVLHANPDDLGTGNNQESLQTGNAGTRMACCVIGKGNPAGWTTVNTGTPTQPVNPIYPNFPNYPNYPNYGYPGFGFGQPTIPDQPFGPFMGFQPQIGRSLPGYRAAFGGQQFANAGQSPLIPLQPFPRENPASSANEGVSKKRK